MHLIPYAGRNYSHTFVQNLLWKEGNVFVMDNHRAAAWCWAQVVAPAEDFAIFHIDRHTDLLQANLDQWCKLSPRIEELSVEGYLGLQWQVDRTSRCPLFRWDNYMPIFIRQREPQLTGFFYCWQNVGDKPWFKAKAHEKHAYDVPENLAYWLGRGGPWIVNLDLDFFFTYQGDEVFIQMYSDDYIVRMAEELKTAHAAGHIKCLTLAISPEMCGGWDAGLRALGVFSKAFGLTLPEL